MPTKVRIPLQLLIRVIRGELTSKEAGKMAGVNKTTISNRVIKLAGHSLQEIRLTQTLERWERVMRKREEGKRLKDIAQEEGICYSAVSMMCQRLLKYKRTGI